MQNIENEYELIASPSLKEEYFNLDIERAILISCLNSKDCFDDVSNLLKEKDFFDIRHQKLYKAMLICQQNNEDIALSFIKKYEKLDEQTLSSIVSTTAVVNIEKYASELRSLAIKRGLINLAHTIPSKLDRSKQASQIIDNIAKDIFELSKEANTSLVKDAPTVIGELLAEFEEQKLRGDKSILGLDTGLFKLNEMTKGFKEGELIILAARPGMGKTTLCLNFLHKSLRDNKGVLLFSLEMPATQIMQRLISEKTSIPLQRLMIFDLNDEEISRVNDACEYFSKKKLFIHDSGYASILDIRAIARKLKMQEESISICAVDYIQLMVSSSAYSDRHLQVSEISRGLKLLARELSLPIIALSQLNRSLESRSNKRPILSDLRESGAIEQDADTILFVYRGEHYKELEEKEKESKARAEGKEYKSGFVRNYKQEEAELIIGKNRHGPTGHIDLLFKKEQSSFSEKPAYTSHAPSDE